MKFRLPSGIPRKIMFAILLSSLIPLAVLGLIALRGYVTGGEKAIARSRQALDSKSAQALELRAVEVANEIADFLSARETDLKCVAILPRTPEAYLDFYNDHQRVIWRLTDSGESKEPFPLYREMAYIDQTGQEIIKISAGRLVSPEELEDVSDPRNTTYKSETYFSETQKLAEGEIYVSHVTGYYVNRAEFEAGKRFEGIVRFAAPVFNDRGDPAGIVVLALDARHIEEFTAHILPTEAGFSVAPDPDTGNYAYVIDDQAYAIAHPTDYLQVGLGPDGETLPYATNQAEIGSLPVKLDEIGFADENLASIHGRAVKGEAGSTQYNWSGHDKFVAYAPIPYYGGDYAEPAGFGWIGISADVTEFHKAATWVEEEINRETRALVGSTAAVIALTALVVIIVASVLARTITRPLLKLTDAAIAVENDQQFEPADIKDVTSGRDEIAHLGRVFSAMVLTLHRRVDELRTVYEIGQSISAALDVDETLQTILDRVHNVVAYDAAEITLFDQTEKQLIVTAWSGHGDYTDTRGQSYELGKGFTGLIGREQRSLLADDIQADKERQAVAVKLSDDAAVRSLLGVPLLIRDRLVGTLELVSRQVGAFNADDQRLLETIAPQAAIAIEKAQQVREREQKLENQIQQLRIEIDEVKRQKQVEQIVGSDYFQTLREKAHSMRERSSGKATPPPK